MRIRRLIALVTALCVFVPAACADSVFDSVGSWFDKVMEDPSRALDEASSWAEGAWSDASEWAEGALKGVSDWAGQAWEDAPEWIGQAWGDASAWISQTWSNPSGWAADIWGSVSEWASEAYDSASVWWDETFEKVTDAAENAWEWIKEDPEGIREQITEKFREAVSALQEKTLSAEERMEKVYRELLERLNIHDGDLSRVMDSIRAYAAEKGISVSAMKEIMLPYLVQLVNDKEESGDTDIPPAAVAQYLTGVVEKTAVRTEEQAQQMISRLKEILAVE